MGAWRSLWRKLLFLQKQLLENFKKNRKKQKWWIQLLMPETHSMTQTDQQPKWFNSSKEWGIKTDTSLLTKGWTNLMLNLHLVLLWHLVITLPPCRLKCIISQLTTIIGKLQAAKLFTQAVTNMNLKTIQKHTTKEQMGLQLPECHRLRNKLSAIALKHRWQVTWSKTALQSWDKNWHKWNTTKNL